MLRHLKKIINFFFNHKIFSFNNKNCSQSITSKKNASTTESHYNNANARNQSVRYKNALFNYFITIILLICFNY